MKNILIIDDDRDLCLLLDLFLARKGYTTRQTHTGSEALVYLEHNRPDLIISDLKLEDIDGINLLKRIKERYKNLPVLIITAYNDIQTSVNAIKQGAFDYITKPIVSEELLIVIEKALAGVENNESKPIQKDGLLQIDQYIFDKSIFLRKVARQIRLVAPTDYSVIIYGESGSGKEAVAREIHKHSKRKQASFIVVNCNSLSEASALEVFFGSPDQPAIPGSLEAAAGGTLFLDDVASLSSDMQKVLLDIIDTKRFPKKPGNIDVDLRVIVASNEPLWDLAMKGKLNENLYHRLNDFIIELAPLRDRKEDILLFANHFLQLSKEESGRNIKGFTSDVEAVLKGYAWPGNLREMRNVINKGVLMTKEGYIETKVLPGEISIAADSILTMSADELIET